MADEQPTKKNHILTTLSAAIGTIVGGGGMWFTVNDSMTKSSEKKEQAIENRVKKDTLVETRIARLEERVEAVRVSQDNLRTELQRKPNP